VIEEAVPLPPFPPVLALGLLEPTAPAPPPPAPAPPGPAIELPPLLPCEGDVLGVFPEPPGLLPGGSALEAPPPLPPFLPAA
jgi:hypothetical protein